MPKCRCPKFGCNGIGLPAGSKKPLSKTNAVIGDTPAYLGYQGSANRLFRTFGYKGRQIMTFECQKCGKTWQQRL